MAFTLEDGTGVAGANSYMTATEFKDYHKDRGTSVSDAGGTGDIQKLLIRGTDYIEQRWGIRFKGGREFDAQPLSFPRLNLLDFDGDSVLGIPDKLKWALAEYALKLATEGLYFDMGDRTGEKIYERVKVGPIEDEARFVGAATTSGLKKFPEADRWLQEYVNPGGRTDRA